MADLSLEQRVNRLESEIFPGGVLTASDGGLSVSPDPSDVEIEKGQTKWFSVSGLTDIESVYVFADPPMIVSAVVDGHMIGVHGVDSGPAGARGHVSVPRNGLPGVDFYVNIIPAKIVAPVDGVGIPTGANP